MFNRPLPSESTPEEFLESEVGVLDLWDAVAVRALLRNKTSRLQRDRKGHTTEVVKRAYWPIPYTPIPPARKGPRPAITLLDTTTTIQPAADLGMPTVVTRQAIIKETQRGLPTVTLERPTLISVRFPDGDQAPWKFADPLLPHQLGGDAPFVSEQILSIQTLQRALGALIIVH